VAWLPEQLSPEPNIIWDVPLGKPGLGGICATGRFVFVADRDFDDFHDVYRCLDAETGDQIWEVQQLAVGTLDYGNSPRTTPLLFNHHVIFFGAFGDLTSVEIKTGNAAWHLNVKAQFSPKTELPWGYCGSPLLVNGKLILNPGAADASIVAIDPSDGSVLWKSPGLASSYGSLIAGTFGERTQIVGHDAKTIGGWDIESGNRLWTITPPFGGEFNVPTPININGDLLVSTEQNGTRRYEFDSSGIANPTPISQNKRLHPDMSSPVLVGKHLYCVNQFLYCLDASDGLKELWRIRDPALSDYGSLIASEDHLMVIGDGEILILKTDGSKGILSRQRLFENSDRIYSHPAMVGNRLFIRGETHLKCVQFD